MAKVIGFKAQVRQQHAENARVRRFAQMKRAMRVHFVDEGQSSTWWDLSKEGYVVGAAQPVWIGWHVPDLTKLKVEQPFPCKDTNGYDFEWPFTVTLIEPCQ